jgi:hypothetical protein
MNATATLLTVLGETAPARDLTASKTAAHLAKTPTAQITGFVLTDERGELGIVDKSACRWVSPPEMWWIMHESATLGRTLQQGPQCQWTQDEDGNWDTACLEKHILTEGTPSENRHLYCPYCGRQLVSPSA